MKKVLIVLFLLAFSAGAYAQSINTRPNVHGGESYYQNGMYLGQSRPNVHGGRSFYPSQGFRGYHGYGNPELQSGYAIGAGLRSIFEAFNR